MGNLTPAFDTLKIKDHIFPGQLLNVVQTQLQRISRRPHNIKSPCACVNGLFHSDESVHTHIFHRIFLREFFSEMIGVKNSVLQYFFICFKCFSEGFQSALFRWLMIQPFPEENGRKQKHRKTYKREYGSSSK